MHPITLEYMVREKQKMLLEEARIDAMRKMARESRVKIRERMLMYVGDIMISAGNRLIKKYSPVVHSSIEIDGKCNGNSCA